MTTLPPTQQVNFDEGDASHSMQGRVDNNWLYGGDYGLALSPLGLMVPRDKYDLPHWNHPRRDEFLKQAFRTSTIFSSVVFGESARVKNSEYILTDSKDDTGRLERYQAMLQQCDFGRGFAEFRSKLTTDLLTQDNGGFIELISDADDRDDPVYTERPLPTLPDSFAYIDSSRCFRTYHPEYPVIYYNPFTGAQRIIHHTRVVTLASFPQGDELGRGKGLCALARSYEQGRILVQTNQYVFEKVIGSAPDIYITNMPYRGAQQALLSDQLAAQGKGFEVFRDPIIMSPKAGGVGVGDFRVEVLSLKSMPDGFDRMDEYQIAMNMVAVGFGVDAREYMPGAKSGETKADAEIQAAKAQGKGIEDIFKMIEWAVNWRIFPPEITLEFNTTNPAIEQAEAEVRSIRANTRAVQIGTGELSVEEARIMAARHEDIDPDFIATAQADDGDDLSADQANVIEDEAFEIKALNTDLAQDLGGLLTDTETGDINRRQMVHRARQAITMQMDESFERGLRDGGYTDPTRSQPQRTAINALIQEHLQYAKNLTQFVKTEPDPEMIEARVAVWQNKAVGEAYNLGLAESGSTDNYEWHLGFTDKSCLTCLVSNGQIHTMTEWKAAGILPQSSNLECGGFHCDCTLKKTTEPKRGIIPSIASDKRSLRLSDGWTHAAKHYMDNKDI